MCTWAQDSTEFDMKGHNAEYALWIPEKNIPMKSATISGAST